MLHFLMQNSVHFYPQQLLTAESVSQSHSGGITCSRKVCCRVNFVIENFVPSLGHAPLKLPDQLLSCYLSPLLISRQPLPSMRTNDYFLGAGTALIYELPTESEDSSSDYVHSSAHAPYGNLKSSDNVLHRTFRLRHPPKSGLFQSKYPILNTFFFK